MYRFNILRLMLATAVIAVVLGILKRFGVMGLPLVAWIAGPIALLVLIARREHAGPILRAALGSGVGVLVAGLLYPLVQPPSQPGDAFRYMIAGALLGWLFAGTRVQLDKAHHESVPEDPRRAI